MHIPFKAISLKCYKVTSSRLGIQSFSLSIAFFNLTRYNFIYCRTHNVCVCLYIAYIACGSALLYIEMLYFFLTVLALLAAATVTNIKIHYDAKTPQFAIFGTRFICVFYSNHSSV